LTGDDEQVRYFVTADLASAAAQDNRAMVQYQVEESTKAPFKQAAGAALLGTDADVSAFLATGSYVGKEQDDRILIAQLIDAGGPSMKQTATAALNGTAAEREAFLRKGRYAAQEQDDRIAVAQAMTAGGPEVKSAGTIALAGPRTALRLFLDVGQHKATQRDQETAAHVANMQAMIAQAQVDAAQAQNDAARAGEAEARARAASDVAQAYADQATASAKAATDFANQAKASAAAALKSAQDAAASAKRASDAAASARASAASADRSAAQATTSAARAHNYAKQAQAAASRAKASAIEAGKSRDEAQRLAGEALQAAIKKQREEAAARQANNQPDPGSTDCDIRLHLAGACTNPLLKAIHDDENWCTIEFGHGPVCDAAMQYYEDKRQEGLIEVQLLLTVCGFVPVVGEPCDAMDALVAYLETGDEKGAILSLLAMVPVEGWLAGGARGADLLRTLYKFKKKACKGSSFLAGTAVLLADGGTAPIESLEPGDRIVATDPATGRTEARPVTQARSSAGLKELVDLTLDADGPAGKPAATITATRTHLFWIPAENAWVEAGSLRTGMQVRESDGHTAPITALRQRKLQTEVHNLSIDGIHTYYVLAGQTSALVHNQNTCTVIRNKMNDVEAAQAQEIGDKLGGTKFDGQLKDNTEGLDGWLDGRPVSLKDVNSPNLAAIKSAAVLGNDQAKNAHLTDVLLYIRADTLDVDDSLRFALGGPTVRIPTEGYIKDIYIRAKGGWIHCTGGNCVKM
jgi:hypothetical protein